MARMQDFTPFTPELLEALCQSINYPITLFFLLQLKKLMTSLQMENGIA